MSSFAPGTPREVMEAVNRRLYGATTDPKPYNPPANAPLAGSPGMKSLLGGLLGGQSQGNLNALLKILASNQQSSGSMADMPPRPKTVKDPARGATGVGSSVMPEMSTPYQPPMKSSPPTGPYIPGFLGMPMPSSPQGPLPDISTMLPALPPQMPVAGMTPAPTPPQMPIRAVEDPYSTTPDLSPGMQQRPAQGLDMQKLMAVLRNMQGRTTAPQAPLVPERTMPIQYDETPLPANVPMSDEQRKRMLEAFMGGAPRMPSPTPVPQTQIGGRSAMGLSGLLSALRASRQR